jgi:hypothetical protein
MMQKKERKNEFPNVGKTDVRCMAEWNSSYLMCRLFKNQAKKAPSPWSRASFLAFGPKELWCEPSLHDDPTRPSDQEKPEQTTKYREILQPSQEIPAPLKRQ